MTKEDWLILRLLMAGAKNYNYSPDYVRSVLYLVDKYTMPVLSSCIDQLRAGGKT
jgi:hypothetical protein